MEKEELTVLQQATTGDRSQVPAVPISISARLEEWLPGTILWQGVWVMGQRGEGSQLLFLPWHTFAALLPRITVHVVPANYFSGQMDTCECCAVREICQHLRHCQLRIFNAFPSTESTTSVSGRYLPPRTFIFLSCSLSGHIYSLIKHTAVSQLMAKLRNPGVLISPSSQAHALTSSWLSGETENDHPEVQGGWFPGRSKLTNILKELARMVVSTCLVVEFRQEGLSGQGRTGLPGRYQDVNRMTWPVGCYQFTVICLMSYYLVSMCCFSCLLQ